MSTSDQQDGRPLTRKQLRELRLTGATPVITADETEQAERTAPPAPPLPRAAEPIEVAPAPVADANVDLGAAPLTRRQAREQERIKTASVPVISEEPAAPESPVEQTDASPTGTAGADDRPTDGESGGTPDEAPEIVSSVPSFGASEDDDDDDSEEHAGVVPVSASATVETIGDVPLDGEADARADGDTDAGQDAAEGDADEAVAALGVDVRDDQGSGEDLLADADDAVAADERATVSPAFGSGLLAEATDDAASSTPSFDELLGAGDSGGSHHTASTLIFNPPPGEGSLSGPVASTGEILITGSYELPQGIGSQGHAHGTADGKEADAVLIDGELPPASSPTPIAASSAISTIKPAGEVIRPPAPEKGNRLMLTLAIVAGGLALALGVVLVIAFTTNVL